MTSTPIDLTSSIPEHVRLIPIEELRLPNRAHNALKRRGIDTLGQVLLLGENGVAGIRNVGPHVLDVIFDTIAQYLRLPRASLALSESLNNANPVTKAPDVEEGTDANGASSLYNGDFEQLLSYPILVLTLSDRARNSLRKAGIETIGDLLDARDVGLGQIRLVGAKTAGDIERALDDFLAHPRRLTDDEIGSLMDSRINVMPMKNPSGQENLLDLIVQISKSALLKSGHERDYEVLRRRYGLEGSDQYTLKEVGDYFDVTRERIRQIEAKAINRVRGILLDDSDRAYRVPRSLIDEANRLRTAFLSHSALMTEHEIKAMLRRFYATQDSPNDIGPVRLLMDIFGFSALTQKVIGLSHELVSSWLLSETINKSLLHEAVIAVNVILLESVTPLSFFDLKVRVNRHRSRKISNDYLKLAVKIDDTIETLPQDMYQIKFAALPSVADKVYRILREIDRPLEIRTLHREMSYRLAKAGRTPDVSVQNLKNQLVSDQRFAPIGRSGTWCLTEWKNVRTDTILDLMKGFFNVHQSDATVDEVYEYIALARPDAGRQTIATYLASRTDLFTKVSSRRYELAAWGSTPHQSSRRIEASESIEQLEAVLKDIFSGESSQPIPLNELVKMLTDRTSIPSSTIRARLTHMPSVSFEPDSENPRAKLVTYHENVQTAPSMRSAPKVSGRQLVQSAIESYLSNEPGRKAAVSDVAKHVIRITGCKRSTFYHYLSKSTSIAKTTEGGRRYCHLRIQEKAPLSISFPQAETISDPVLKQNVDRAIANLDIDNIDMGLFYFGKIFENELKTFLLETQAAGTYTVSSRDLARLASMIDWLEQNAIVKEKHHLSLLREQRNERAHGDIPDHPERERLLRHAPFLGDLYIKYILLFRQKSDELRKLRSS